VAEVIEEDGFFPLTVRLPDGKQVTKVLDLYEQWNRLSDISRQHHEFVAANDALAAHWQKLFNLEAPPSHKCAVALTNAVFDEVKKTLPIKPGTDSVASTVPGS
jgi:hypothetical protein